MLGGGSIDQSEMLRATLDSLEWIIRDTILGKKKRNDNYFIVQWNIL